MRKTVVPLQRLARQQVDDEAGRIPWLRWLDFPKAIHRLAGVLPDQLWTDQQGQDVAEYAIMLAIILVIVIGTIRLIGSSANNVFSSVGSAIQ
jgi:Flp pilus assembly pilin Flp